MAQSRAYNHKKHMSLYQIMVQSNTKHTDLDRIDQQENELRIDIEENELKKKIFWGKIMFIPNKER